jgi:MFS family permease
MSFFCISFYLAVYCSSLGLRPGTSTGIVAGFNLAGLSGEIIVGHLCDRFPYPLIIFGIGTIGTLSAFLLLGLVQSLLGVVFFVLLYGMAAGSFPSIWTSSAYDVSRLKSMQTANVILSFTFVRGIAAVIGPLVAASLYDPLRNKDQAVFGAFGFDKLIIFVGTCMAILVACTPVLSLLRKKVTVIVNQSSLQEQF